MHILAAKLQRAKNAFQFRELLSGCASYVDLASNDYLGIVYDRRIPEQTGRSGATGSRLISGQSVLVSAIENKIAAFHRAEAALIFNSGYAANTGLISSVAGRTDVVLYDQRVHVSIREGIRLSYAKAYAFRHNQLSDLEEKLYRAQRQSARIFVLTESVFSMDGAIAPLSAMAALCRRFGAHFIVDEAHATGIIGAYGRGLVADLGLEHQVFARVYTFGKALGALGAAVAGARLLKEYLINFSRPFIYTTALPEPLLRAVNAAYDLLASLEKQRRQLRLLTAYFQSLSLPFEKIPSKTPIQGLLVSGNERVLQVAQKLRDNGFFAVAIRAPTVDKGTERIRLVLHSFNTKAELVKLAEVLRSI